MSGTSSLPLVFLVLIINLRKKKCYMYRGPHGMVNIIIVPYEYRAINKCLEPLNKRNKKQSY